MWTFIKFMLRFISIQLKLLVSLTMKRNARFLNLPLTADALADAYDAGLVKTVGVSNYGLDEVKRMHAALLKRGIPLASNQISYSLVRNIPEKSSLIQSCHDLGIAILAYSRKV